MLQIKHGLGLGLFNEEFDSFMTRLNTPEKNDKMIDRADSFLIYEKKDSDESRLEFKRFCKGTELDIKRGIIFPVKYVPEPFCRVYDSVDDIVDELKEKLDASLFDEDFDWEAHMGEYLLADSDLTQVRK